MKFFKMFTWLLMGSFILSGCTISSHNENQMQHSEYLTTRFEIIPENKDTDLRVFYTHDVEKQGVPALEQMKEGVDLSLWLAGNQYFAMEKVIKSFFRENPSIQTVAIITLPPGDVARAIVKGGWNYKNKDYEMQPDIYGTVDTNHLIELAKSNLMKDYFTYMHNELSLMVAAGNPKKITSIQSLGRSDLKIYLPNPIDEGIMSMYGKKVLMKHHLWEKLSAGKECKACWGASNVYFTDVHHRETPEAIQLHKADVGLVWLTEGINAEQNHLPVSIVKLSTEDSAKNDVNYFLGAIEGSKHSKAVQEYFEFLKSKNAKDAYESFGFTMAKASQFVHKPINSTP